MKLITECSECIIKTFISCKYDNNFIGLIIKGEPTKEQLLEAFENIETEFNDLCGTVSEELKQANKINALIARNESVKLCFFAIDEALRRADVPCLDALPLLKQNNIRITWNNDIEDFKKQVQTAKTRNITKEVELEDLTKELETLQKQSTKSPEFTKKNFYQLIHAIQALGYKITEHETNMYSFAVMCHDYFNMTRKQSAS